MKVYEDLGRNLADLQYADRRQGKQTRTVARTLGHSRSLYEHFGMHQRSRQRYLMRWPCVHQRQEITPC